MEENTINNKHKKFGIFLVIMSCLFFSTGEAMTVKISRKIDAMVVSEFRFTAQAFILVPFVLKQYTSIYQLSKLDLCLTSLSGVFLSLANVIAYISIYYIPIVDISAIFNIRPIFTLVISFFWLKESIRYLEKSMAILVVIGILLIYQPYFLFGKRVIDASSGLNYSWKGYFLSIVSTILVSFVLCITRRMNNVHLSVFLYFQSIAGIFTMLIIQIFTGYKLDCDNYLDIFYLIGIIICEIMGRTLVTNSAKYIESNIISILLNLELIVTLCYQLIWFQIYPNFLEMLGVIFVIISATVITHKDVIYKMLNRLFSKLLGKLSNNYLNTETEHQNLVTN